jgi:Ca2+-transporting ATPase
VQGDPTEGALLVAARKVGIGREALDARLPRIGEIPFSSERKLMSTVHEDREHGGRVVLFAKGAPDVLLSRCTAVLVGDEPVPLTGARRAATAAANERLAGAALRTLGVAFRTLPGRPPAAGEGEALERDLVFLGLVGMIDPPREEARNAVARARRAGIRPVMITGDHPITASVIARELGIADDDRVLTGLELRQLDDGALARAVREVSVYARVNPEDKLRLVEVLRGDGAVVAMTGDGVNDAPALKAADIGVAMGITGTDVAKEAADMVLADDDFATIVAAVEEGRGIFDNIRKFLRYLLSSNIGEVTTMFFGVLLARTLGLEARAGEAVVLPLLATQVLWINLLTDGLPALALGVDPADPDVMDRPPRPRGERVVTARMWRGIFLVGATMAAGSLLVLDASMPGGLIRGAGDLAYGQTMTFTTLVFFQLFNVFNARSDERSAFHRMFANRWLLGAVGAALALQLLVVYLPALQRAFGTVPLAPLDWLKCAIPASMVLWIREATKLVARRTA